MNFGQAITAGFQNYVNFAGRAIRSEFWYWFLFAVLVSIATSVIGCLYTTVGGPTSPVT